MALVLRSLKPSKAPGEDGLCSRVLKNLPNRAINWITHLFNICLILNYFPTTWKCAKVFPLLKPGKPASAATSYRPISLLSTLGKVFEKLILQRLQLFIEDSGCIPHVQFGFRKGHSTALQILRIVNHVKSNFELKKSTGFVAFDVEKAFDRVWHSGLLYKLIKLNCPRYLIKLLSSYLENRSFTVNVTNCNSNSFPIEFGVPQGSVLSPVLYNIYTSDLPQLKDCELAIFADDTAIFTSSKFYKQIKRRLESAARKLSRYFHKWKISLNKSKTEATFFTRRTKKQLPSPRSRLSVVGGRIKWSDSVKYLGCHLNKSMTLKGHVDKCLAKSVAGLKSLYPLIHRRSVLSAKLKTKIYKSFLRPVLLYPIIVFPCISMTNRKRIQTCQNKFLKTLNNLPWDTKTTNLHLNLKIPLIDDFIEKLAIRAEIKYSDSENPLIRKIYNA